MASTTSPDVQDMNVLLWIVGSRKGASFDEIVERECARRRNPPTQEQIRDSVARLESKKLVRCEADRYLAVPRLQEAFLNECRNCRDTLEESDILRRILAAIE